MHCTNEAIFRACQSKVRQNSCYPFNHCYTFALVLFTCDCKRRLDGYGVLVGRYAGMFYVHPKFITDSKTYHLPLLIT